MMSLNHRALRAAGFIPAVRTTGVKPAARLALLWLTLLPTLCPAQPQPPLIGRPKDFTGLVGQYSLAVAAVPTQVKVGEPITLTVGIHALSADSRPPTIKHLHLFPDNLTERFHIEEPERIIDKGRTWELAYRIRPKHPGDQTLPSLKLVYFHPGRQKYQATYSEAIEINVLPTTTARKLPQLPAFLLETPSDAEILERVNSPLISHRWLQFVMIAVPPIACLVWYFLRCGVKGEATKSTSRFGERLVSRLREESTVEGLAALFVGYLRERFDLRIAAPTPADVEHYLRRLPVPRDLLSKCVDFLRRCDASMFGMQQNVPETMREYAIQIVVALEEASCLHS